MKVLFAVFSLCAVAVFALRGDQARRRFSEVGDSDVEAFRSGQTYKYRLDTQISSGFASISDQHAVTRLQAEALLHFQSERLVTLKLNDVVIGTLNQEVQEPERVQPFGMFKETQIKSEEARQLELPCTFDYVDGLVERVRFHQDDKSWSKNIKKSVLNMLQINLKQRQGENTKLEQLPEWKQERELETSQNKAQSENRMFVMPETTLEGECQVSYTMNKMRPTNKFNSYNDNSHDEVKMFNVTKSINFRQCAKIADIQYGPKIEKACDNCTTERLEERKLDRTTILRQVVVGTPEKYGIKKVELVSHYIFKMLNVEEEAPMHTIVVGELNYIRIEESRSELERGLRGVSTSEKAESLLYSIEWDEQEKRFYMYGDEEFPDNSPFEKVQDKVGKVEQQLKKLINMWSDKTSGIETEATFTYSKIVELVRMCNQEELKQIFSRISSKFSEEEQRKAEDILIDALSNAGTHNTIKVLAEKIQRKEISQARAVRALVQLKDLPAPSEKQVKIITDLCQNEVCKRHEPCRQVCWLTSGSIIGKLCSEDLTSRDALEQKKSPCHLAMKKEFVTKIMTQYSKVETRYEKILLLKTLGNAGLEPSVYELEKIIRDIREEPIVRMQAIDSLRRLRAVMPHKIQRILMPIFQNVRERPEIRMMALSQIFATIPEKPILDQIGLTLIRDPSRQVRSYVYGAMQKLAESPIMVEKELARHLKGLNKLANINEEDEEVLLRGSRYYRIPVYSQAKKEGFFVELESMVGTENVLPKHLSAGLDTYFNGLFQKNSLEVSFTQEDLEQWAEKLMNVYMDYQHGDSLKKSLRGYRSSDDSDSSEADKDFRSIVQGLGIKRRSSPRVDSDSETQNNAPYGMLCFRYGDIDYAVLPLEEEHLTPALKKLLINGEKPSPRDFEYLVDIVQGRPFRVQAAMHLLEHSIKIPTSMGLPVRMWHVIPVLASVEGQVKPKLSGSEVNVEVKLHPRLAISHLKRIEIWTPVVNTGVETSRTGMINLPVNAQIQIRDGVKLSIEVPQNRFRALALNSMPFTYTSEQDRQQVVKRVENKNLIHRLQPIEKVYGKHNFGMPLKISGDVHSPQQWTYGRIVNALMTSENHLQVVFDPTEDTPREIRLTARGESFGQADRSSSNHRELKDFYSKSKFDTEMDQDFEEDRDSERRFSKFVDDFQPRKMYNHKMSVKIQTVGGRQEKEAQVDLEAACDSENRYVKAKMNVKRSPLPSLDESSSWTMKTQLQAILPETHSTIQQYRRQQGEKQQKLVCQIESEWGTDEKQKVNFNINGEQARSRQAERIDSPQLQQQMIQKIAFLNKYDISAEYSQIKPETKNFANYMSTLLKTWNFWNTKVELKSDSRRDSQRDGQITATVVIDPITHEHVNVTLKTPVEIVRIGSMRLPMKAKPFKLVKPSQTQKSVDSFTELVHSYASESRPECKVDSSKIRSFDDAIFKAPLTKCYSVLAKDCRSENPRFAVLMKKIDDEKKAMKILSNGDRIEIQPERNGKLIVKINGRREENEDTLREHGIEATQDLVHFNSRDVTVRFDGEQALIKISPFYKNQQCGLCGHYNDDTEDDFRMSNNEMTSDIKSYHKSYSMVDDECREDLEKTHRDEEYKPLKDSRWSSEEESEQKRRRTERTGENGLIEKTEVMEYNHKICFSLKPIKACPENSYPEKTKDVKISFTCLDRSSSEARRLLRETRRSNGPVDIRKEHKISFVETIAVPTTCAEY